MNEKEFIQKLRTECLNFISEVELKKRLKAKDCEFGGLIPEVGLLFSIHTEVMIEQYFKNNGIIW